MTDKPDDEQDVLQVLMNRPGLQGWAKACMTLLALTEGIERWMETEDEFPHNDLRKRVGHALSSDEEAQLLDIAEMEVFHYRVMSEVDMTLWQPLKESLKAFEGRHNGQVRVWQHPDAKPDKKTVQTWLSQRVAS